MRVTPVHNGAAPDIIYWYLASPIIRLLVKLITLFPVALHYTRPPPMRRRAGGESSDDGSPYLMANVSHHPANTGKLGIVPRPPYPPIDNIALLKIRMPILPRSISSPPSFLDVFFYRTFHSIDTYLFKNLIQKTIVIDFFSEIRDENFRGEINETCAHISVISFL